MTAYDDALQQVIADAVSALPVHVGDDVGVVATTARAVAAAVTAGVVTFGPATPVIAATGDEVGHAFQQEDDVPAAQPEGDDGDGDDGDGPGAESPDADGDGPGAESPDADGPDDESPDAGPLPDPPTTPPPPTGEPTPPVTPPAPTLPPGAPDLVLPDADRDDIVQEPVGPPPGGPGTAPGAGLFQPPGGRDNEQPTPSEPTPVQPPEPAPAPTTGSSAPTTTPISSGDAVADPGGVGVDPADPTPEDLPEDAPDGAAQTDDVVRTVEAGDSLWVIATDILDDFDDSVTTSEIAGAVQVIYQANADIIGPDPDLLLIGLELTIPSTLSSGAAMADGADQADDGQDGADEDADDADTED